MSKKEPDIPDPVTEEEVYLKRPEFIRNLTCVKDHLLSLF